MNFKVHLVDYLSFMIPGILYLLDLGWIIISLSNNPEAYFQYILKLNIFHFFLILLLAFITARILNPVLAPMLNIIIKNEKIIQEVLKEVKETYPMLNFHFNINKMDMLFFSGKFANKNDFDPMEITSTYFGLYQNFSIAILIFTIYELFYFFYSGFIYKHLIIFFIFSYVFIVMVRAYKFQIKNYYLSFYSKIISYVLKPEFIVSIKNDEVQTN